MSNPPAAAYFCEACVVMRANLNIFKKVAKSRKPDVILTNKKTVTTRGKNRNEKKYEKSSTRNYERNLLKRLKTDF